MRPIDDILIYTSSSEQFRRRRKEAVVSTDFDIGVGASVDVLM